MAAFKKGDAVWVHTYDAELDDYVRMAYYQAEFGGLVLVQWYKEGAGYSWVKKGKVTLAIA